MEAFDERRIRAIEKSLDKLWRLVDSPHEETSHRRRLNALKDNDNAVGLAKRILEGERNRFREWLSISTSVAAVAIAAVALLFH